MTIAPFRKKYFGEILVANGFVTKEHLKEALEIRKQTNEKIGVILLNKGYISKENYFDALSKLFSLQLVQLSKTKIEEEVLQIIPERIARKYTIMPISKQENTLKIAVADPTDGLIIAELESISHLNLSMVMAPESDIMDAIEKYYSASFGSVKDMANEMVEEVVSEEFKETKDNYEESNADAAPVVKYVNAILYEAVTKKASDIHVEPGDNSVSLRMRIDGELVVCDPPPKKYFSSVISRIKIMANLDIAERRLPQDGKCRVKVSNKKVDVRVSTLPTLYGEKIVMRILDRSALALDINKLGFSEADVEKYTDSLARPYGMILVTGPTGSGKTTTLYTGLNSINTPDKNIITIEDPVEYEIKGINQVLARPSIGLTFASILRSVLRQDPDIIMIGEIRDKETAEISIQAALTGHLVLSTLHTNDAVSTLSRMAYMGIEPFLITDAVDLVISQRLIRIICPDCKAEQEISDPVRRRLALDNDKDVKFFYGKGCDKCYGSGYRGRNAIIEALKLTPELKKMILDEESDQNIKELALQQGMHTLRNMAVGKLKEGLTTVEEVLSVTVL
ncbi:MAG: Flp pilus assembly complex ATPase component TadA [Elusimicrobia bacterium]|nr:Flp pilus assembly complex ATPase component TadA [Candidatus Liberimonas magnetica]